MTFIKPLLGLGAVAVLSACGGSSSTRAFTEFEAAFLEQIERHDVDRQQSNVAAITDPASLPVSGDAVYNGTIMLDSDFATAAGTLDLTANWKDAIVTGGAGDFITDDGIAIGGTLDISNGTLDRAADVSVDYTFTADIAGTLSAANSEGDITGQISGDFYGDDFAAVFGRVNGNATVAGDTGLLTGEFVAER